MVRIATGIGASADLSERAGLPLRLERGHAVVGAGVVVEEDRLRRLGELAAVTAEPVGRRGRRIEYRMLNGVRLAADAHLDALPSRYELTAMRGRPIGHEAAKTAGHVHVRPTGSQLGYPEIVEVVHGEAGFLIAALHPGPDGPISRHAWLVRAGPGDWVVLPPELAHVTIDLGAGPLVFSDVIDRRATGIYSGVAAAHGFAWYIDADGRCRANPSFTPPLPTLQEVVATDWSGPAAGPLYERFRDDPASFAWLSDPSRFPVAAPSVWRRVGPALGNAVG
jgi:glucose-6-phosphate isomerase, archaeal